MQHGHCTGKKIEQPHASDWYRTIEEANIARIEAQWAARQAQPQPAPQSIEER